VLAVASFSASLATMRVDAAAAFFLPHARAWELMTGAAVATMATSASPDRHALRFQIFAIAGLALTVASFVIITEARPFPGWWPALPVAATALVIVSGPRMWVNRSVFSQRWLVGVGLISYPLYLWHWPLLVFARIAMVRPSLWLRAGLMVVALVLSYATYRLIEQPVRAGRWKRNPWTVVALAACSICVGLISVAAATGRLMTRTDARLGLITRPYDYRNAYRGKRCQLGENQRPRDFDPACVDGGFGQTGVTSLLIWGDSHGAHLYPGLRALAVRDHLALAQFTADGCAPVTVDGTKPYCRALNDFVLSQLTHLRPDVVILSADWTDERAASIPATLARVRAETRAPIVVVGPVPAWDPDLPTTVATFARLHPIRGVPERLLDGLHSGRAELDARMRDDLAPTGVRYVSPMSVLCTADGCLAVGDGRLIAWDATHLTDAGSSIVAEEILRQLPVKR
jgi:SGNH domain-containing protein